jgi:6-pyruvoyltetrahydropterin/6-carboxytetrahydropterin synthase
MFEIYKEFRFEAAHRLPEVPPGHPCSTMHGHSYRCRVYVRGELKEPQGWVVDYHDIKRAFAPILKRLDHTCLNDIEGLANPTSEILARWIYERLAPNLPGLGAIEICETESSGCVYRPEA